MTEQCIPARVLPGRCRPGLFGRFICTPLVALLFSFCTVLSAPAIVRGSEILPPSVRVALTKAGTMMQEERYTEAAEFLTAFVKRSPSTSAAALDRPPCYAEIFHLLGTCQLVIGQHQKARQSLETAVALNPTHVAAWLNLGKAAYELEAYQTAAIAFDRAFTNSNEPDPNHLYYSGVAYLLAGQYARAISVFEHLLETFPERIELNWLEHYVHALLAAERYSEAVSPVRQLAMSSTGKKQLQWQEQLLHLYLQLERFKEAKQYARFLTNAAPGQAKWWKILASLDLQEGNYEQALATMLIAGFLKPLDEAETKLVANLFLQLGIPGQAAPLYQELLKKGKEANLLINLVITLRQLDQNAQALDVLDSFAPHTKDVKLLAQRADLLFALERYEEAIPAFRLLAQIDDKNEKQARQMIEYATAQSARLHEAKARHEATMAAPGT